MSRVTLAAYRLGRWDAYPSAVYGRDDMGALIGLAALQFTLTVPVVASRGLLELRDVLAQSVGLSDRLAQYVELRDSATTVSVSDG